MRDRRRHKTLSGGTIIRVMAAGGGRQRFVGCKSITSGNGQDDMTTAVKGSKGLRTRFSNIARAVVKTMA